MPLNTYYNRDGIEAAVRNGKHREVIGGLWDEVGQLQADFLISMGLKPHHKLIDIGCGSLRGGVKLVPYLDTGNYFGTDINACLLGAGYTIELAAAGVQHKVPREQLVADGSFDFSWAPVRFDFAVAQSLFTHLPIDMMRLCLERLAPAMAPRAVMYATFFEVPQNQPTGTPYRHAPGTITTHGDKDPFHFSLDQIEQACLGLPWKLVYIGEWGHPRGQRMLQFTRLALPGS